MVAQAQTTRTRTAKKAYRPRITPISATEYLIGSETYGGHILYQVTVHGAGVATCECSAGAHGRVCKHVRLVLGYHAYRQNPSHIRSVVEHGGVAADITWEDLAAECSALPVPAFDFRAAREPIDIRDYMTAPVTVTPAPDSFMECFA